MKIYIYRVVARRSRNVTAEQVRLDVPVHAPPAPMTIAAVRGAGYSDTCWPKDEVVNRKSSPPAIISFGFAVFGFAVFPESKSRRELNRDIAHSVSNGVESDTWPVRAWTCDAILH